MIYGASGYTGQLVAERAAALGMRPILAGRSESKIKALAESLGLEHASFSLEDGAQVARQIESCAVVLHCAGPFTRTAEPMLNACIQTGAHYVDITGEIPVFALADSMHQRARDRGVMLLPGAGFDVVPTDCAALRARKALPDATEISHAFSGLGGVSAGTARSALLQMPEGGKLRRGGRLIEAPLLSPTRTIRFGARMERRCAAIPWGDLFTAARSTGASDITVYTYVPGALRWFAQTTAPFRGLLRQAWLSKPLESALAAALPGPSAELRERGHVFVWAEARTMDGRSAEVRLLTREAYSFTAISALEAIRRILADQVQAGYRTPAGVWGDEFVLSINGSRYFELGAKDDPSLSESV